MSFNSSQIALLGIRVDNVTMDEVLAKIDAMIGQGGYHQIATANVDFLSKAMSDPDLTEILHSCDLVLPDGMPLVWASRLMGTALKERITGADLLPLILDLSARKKRRVFLLGATEERSLAAVERMQREYPGAILAGRLSPPPASLESMENAAILKQIEEARPDVLLVAFGNPKQEKWLAMHRDRLNVPVCIGVGASIDFFSGMQSRAPMWIQRLGMEWMFRLFSEPRRLGPRYLENALFLLRYLSLQLFITSMQPSKTASSNVSMNREDDVLVARVTGDFKDGAVRELQRALASETSQSSLIVDLSSTHTLWPDAAGLLAHLTRQRKGTEAQVWLSGLHPAVRSVLRNTFPAGHSFHISASVEDAMRALNKRGAFAFQRSNGYLMADEFPLLSSLAQSRPEAMYYPPVPRVSQLLQRAGLDASGQYDPAAAD